MYFPPDPFALAESVLCNYFGTPKSIEALRLSKEGLSSKLQLISAFSTVAATFFTLSPLAGNYVQSSQNTACGNQGKHTDLLNKIMNRFLIRNFGGQKAVGRYIQTAKKKIVSQESYVWQNSPLRVRVKLRHSQMKSEGMHY